MTAEVIHGDCLEVMQGIDPATVALVLTDPPYGVGVRTNYFTRGRTGPKSRCNNFTPLHGDDRRFDPSPLFRFHRLILFGANHYADKLPTSPSWIVWDKLNGLTSKRGFGFNDQSDCEMAWTNLGGPARLIPHRWMGALKESEYRDRRVHPTQKPVWLMARLIEQFTKQGDIVLDPYAGSGSTGVACVQTGRRFIGIESEAEYCEIARRRIAHWSPEPMLEIA